MSGMSIKTFTDLAKFSRHGLPAGYPVDSQVTLFSPEDDLHGALSLFVDSVQHSLSLAIYGFDDDALATAILRKMQDPNIFVQLCLDSTQAAGKHEKALLVAMNMPSNVVAFGQSEAHAIMHLKMGVMDGLDSFRGSTNWSTSGETKQDNELTFTREPLIAFQMRHKIDVIHASMLTQMEAKTDARMKALYDIIRGSASPLDSLKEPDGEQ
jgi:phosphatidylserine/phosphatidylglycerophosphate/cardiolipin synthase-like enzyme